MIPTVGTLTRPQRAGYVLSLLLMSAGWLLFLALILEWSSVHWSRAAIALQAGALVLALLLAQRVPTRRLVVYPLIIAASIYLWDTTLPPPNLPNGWPRVLVPRLVLVGLLVDCALTVRRAQQWRPNTIKIQPRLALDDAAMLLGLSSAELRVRMQQHRHVIVIDVAGREQVLLDDVHALNRPKKTAWWQLYLWFLLMLGLSALVALASIPTQWKTAVHAVWCMLTLGGMSVWIWINRVALQAEEWVKSRAWKRRVQSAAADEARTIPLTPVQQRFLEVMERDDHQ